MKKIMLSITKLLHNWQPTKLKQASELVLNDSANFVSAHFWAVGEMGWLQHGQLLICLFQYLYVSDLWVASYIVRHVFILV